MQLPPLSDMLAIRRSGLYGDSDHDIKGFGGISLPAGYLADIFRVPIDYVMEIHIGGELKTAIVLPNTPSSIDVKRATATDVTYTLGSGAIREHTNNRHLMIELSGRSGIASRSGHNRNGETIYKPGPFLMREFDGFLDLYQKLASESTHSYLTDPENYLSSQRVELIFRAFDEKIHLKVEPKEWNYTKNANSSRFSAEWKLVLQAYAPAIPEEPSTIFGDTITSILLWATEAISAMNAAISLGDNLLKNVRSDLELLRGPFRQLVETGNLMRSMAETIGSLADFPRALLADMALAAAQFSGALEDIKQVSSAEAWTKHPLRKTKSAAEKASILSATAYGVHGGGPEAVALRSQMMPGLQTYNNPRSDNSGGVWRGATPGWLLAWGRQLPLIFTDTEAEQGGGGLGVVHEFRPGESLQMLALRYLGNSRAWPLIIERNRMLDASTLADGAPLTPGDTLIIPTSGGQRLPFASNRDDPAGMFGKDFLLTPRGDLEISADKKDVSAIQAAPLFEQALRNRLLCHQGGSRYFPSYGLPVIPGDSMSSTMLVYVASHVHEQLLKDPRVSSVLNLAALDDGDGLGVTVQVVPKVGNAMTLIAPLPA